jgi:hypothetical protein
MDKILSANHQSVKILNESNENLIINQIRLIRLLHRLFMLFMPGNLFCIFASGRALYIEL